MEMTSVDRGDEKAVEQLFEWAAEIKVKVIESLGQPIDYYLGLPPPTQASSGFQKFILASSLWFSDEPAQASLQVVSIATDFSILNCLCLTITQGRPRDAEKRVVRKTQH